MLAAVALVLGTVILIR
ncbi:hypothetical protein ACLK1W_22940 [Escherichia coli]